MRTFSLLLAALCLVACPEPSSLDEPTEVCDDAVDNDADGLADCADSDCSTAADCVDVLASSCPDAAIAMQALDVPVANAAYASCLAEDASNSEAAFGVAITDFLLLGDWSSSSQALQWCSQSTDVTDQFFGPDGLAIIMDDAYNGSSDLGIRYDPGTGAAATPVTSLVSPELILSELWERSDELFLSVDVQSSIGGGARLSLWLPLADVYRDGSNEPLQTGVGYSVRRLAQAGIIDYRAACEDPGSRCNGFAQSGEASGTLTFTGFQAEEGAELAFEIDAQFPANCEDTPCPGEYVVLGSVVDTVAALPDAADLPFGDVDPACFQSGVGCDYDTEFMSVIADVCDVTSFDAARGLVSDMADELDGIADNFDRAGQDEDLSFLLPATRLFFAHTNRTFNQTDALLVAASVRSVAATARLGAQYNWFDPSASPDSLTSTYSTSWLDYDTEECVAYDTTGVSQDALIQAADGHLGTHISGADFDAVNDGLVQAFTAVVQAVDSQPTATGFVSAQTTDAAYQAWLDALATDVEALLDSLQGEDGPVPSAPSIVLGFGSFFESPTDRASVLSDLGLSSFLYADSGECRDVVQMDYAVGDWITQGADFGLLPTDASYAPCSRNSDCRVTGEVCDVEYGECVIALPVVFDANEWDRTLDAEDTPFFFTEQARDQADEWAY